MLATSDSHKVKQNAKMVDNLKKEKREKNECN